MYHMDIGRCGRFVVFVSIFYRMFHFTRSIQLTPFSYSLAAVWSVPMRPTQQRFWFHLLEIIEAWSALDVWFVSTLAATMEISGLSQSVLGGAFPGLENLVENTFKKSLFVVDETLLDGLWLVLVGIIAEKLLSQFIVNQAATAIASRFEQEQKLLHPNEQDNNEATMDHPEILTMISPAARYLGASAAPKYLYSGLPRKLWTVGIKLGLMEAVPRDELQDEAYATMGIVQEDGDEDEDPVIADYYHLDE